MKYLLDDDAFKLSYILKDSHEILDFQVFCSFYKIHTISDFLEHGEAARSEAELKDIVEEFKKIKLKFDDELTEEKLEERNRERERLEMEKRKKLAQKRAESLLKSNISILGLPNSIKRKLYDYQMYTIDELIDGSSYIFFGKNVEIFKESEINKITRALNQYGLYLNMLNPVSETIDMPEIEVEEEQTPVVEVPVAAPAEQTSEKQQETSKRKIVKWEDRINYIKAFFNYFGHTFIPEKFAGADNIGKWITTCRSKWNKGRISDERIKDLELSGMSKEGLGSYQEIKRRKLDALNIKEIIIKDGVLYTYYLDGSLKSTNDEEFIKMLNGEEVVESKVETTDIKIVEESKTSTDMNDEEMEKLMQQVFEQIEDDSEIDSIEEVEIKADIETDSRSEVHDSQDMYSLMEARIQEMKSRRETINEENKRKQALIQEYKKLKAELDRLIHQGTNLDAIIEGMIGISIISKEETSIKTPLTAEDFQDIQEQIKQMIDEKREENKRKQALIQEFKQEEEELRQVQVEGEELDSEIESIFNPNSKSKVKKLGEE